MEITPPVIVVRLSESPAASEKEGGNGLRHSTTTLTPGGGRAEDGWGGAVAYVGHAQGSNSDLELRASPNSSPGCRPAVSPQADRAREAERRAEGAEGRANRAGGVGAEAEGRMEEQATALALAARRQLLLLQASVEEQETAGKTAGGTEAPAGAEGGASEEHLEQRLAQGEALLAALHGGQLPATAAMQQLPKNVSPGPGFPMPSPLPQGAIAHLRTSAGGSLQTITHT